MKRLGFLTTMACLALFMSACGENAEKKVESGATTTIEQTTTDQKKTPETETTADPTKTGPQQPTNP